MITLEDKIYNYINRDISAALIEDENKLESFSCKKKKIFISGKEYYKDCWIEDIPEGKLFVIELTSKKFFLDKVYTEGILIKGDSKSVVNQEAMWELGLG